MQNDRHPAILRRGRRLSEFALQCVRGGEWPGIRPSGKTLTFTGANIGRGADGKIPAHSGVMNTLESLWQEHIIGPAQAAASFSLPRACGEGKARLLPLL